MKTYYVTIEAVVRKTIQVEAETRQEAVEDAHALFTTECDGDEEHYDEQTVSVREED